MSDVIWSMPPVVDEGCTKLIVGSIPGEASLAAGHYYAHPRNAFWPIICKLLAAGDPPASYEERLALLQSAGIGLWDVISSCEREGSLDSAIRHAETNDIPGLLLRYPKIRSIYCNGAKAHELLLRRCGTALVELGAVCIKLPSTSPAYTLNMDKKAEQWRLLMA